MARGRMKYIPPSVFEELEKLKTHKGIKRDSEAFNEMAKLSEVGREIERLMYFGRRGRNL